MISRTHAERIKLVRKGAKARIAARSDKRGEALQQAPARSQIFPCNLRDALNREGVAVHIAVSHFRLVKSRRTRRSGSGALQHTMTFTMPPH